MAVVISKKVELGVTTEYYPNGKIKCKTNGSHIVTYDTNGLIHSILFNSIYYEFARESGCKRIVNIITGANCNIDDLIDNDRRKAACRQIGVDESICTGRIGYSYMHYHDGITEIYKDGVISLESNELPNAITYIYLNGDIVSVYDNVRINIEHTGQLADAPSYLISYMINELFLKPRANEVHAYVYEQFSTKYNIKSIEKLADDTQKQLNIINRWYAACAAEILTKNITNENIIELYLTDEAAKQFPKIYSYYLVRTARAMIMKIRGL